MTEDKKLLAVFEIRQDPELVRLNKLMHETLSLSRARLDILYKENNIEPLEFTGLGVGAKSDDKQIKISITKPIGSESDCAWVIQFSEPVSQDKIDGIKNQIHHYINNY